MMRTMEIFRSVRKGLVTMALWGMPFFAHAAAVDLVMLKEGPVSARAGEAITYTLTMRNSGPDAANGAVFQDALPAGMSLTGVSCIANTGGASCPTFNNSGNTAAGTVSSFPAGSEVKVTVAAQIPVQSSTSYSNTATIAAPAGTIETNPASNSSTVSTSVALLTADLATTISPANASWTLGTPVTYTVTYTNHGPDALPPSFFNVSQPSPNVLILLTNISTTCASTGGAVCPAFSFTALPSGLAALPAGGSLTFTTTFTPAASTACTNNTGGTVGVALNSNIYVPNGVIDSNQVNNFATVTGFAPVANPLCPPVAISGSKTGPANFIFGTEQSYTMVLENTGTIPADGSKISDSFYSNNNLYPIGQVVMNGIRIVCVAEGGAVCPAFSVPSSITFGSQSGATFFSSVPVATWPAGGKLTLTMYFTMRLASPLPCGAPLNVDISNTLSVVPSGQSTTKTVGSWRINTPSGNQPCPSADLQITRSAISQIPFGTPLPPYTVTVTNNGPAAADGALLSETLAFLDSPNPVMKSVDVACAATNGAQCPASPMPTLNTHGYFNNIAIPVLPPGGSVTFTFSNAVVVLGSAASCFSRSTGSLLFISQTAAPTGIADNNTVNNRVTTATMPFRCAAISVNKQVSKSAPSYGEAITYTINVSNATPGADAAGAMINDALPAGFEVTGAPMCGNTTGGAVCGPVSYDPGSHLVSSVAASLPAGGGLQIAVSGKVGKPGSWSNTASVPVNVGDLGSPQPGSASSTVNFQAIGVDLGIEKNGPATYVPGAPISYTLVVTNYGNPVSGATITDNVPATIDNVTWTCASLNLAACGQTSGSGNAISLTGSFPQGGTTSGKLVITVSGTVSAGASGDIENTATVTDPGGVDLDPANNIASVTSVQTLPADADLSLDKRVTPQHYSPGDTLTYTLTVSNAGPAGVAGAVLSDTMPTGVTATGWTCSVASGTANCSAGSGSGAPDGAAVDLGANDSVTFIVTATVDSGTTGNLVNTARIDPPGGINDPDPDNNEASVTVQPQGIPPVGADVRIVKTVAPSQYIPGTAAAVTYSLIVSNNGPDNAIGVAVTDTALAGVTIERWTCMADSGNQCPAGGGGALDGVLVDLINGGQVIFTVQAAIAATASGDLINVATAALPATSPPDPNPANNIASATIAAGTPPQAALGISKTSSTTDYTPGTTVSVSYTLLVGNDGPDGVIAATVKDTPPAGLTLGNWTCAVTVPGSGGVTTACPAGGSGMQLQNGIAIDLAVGSVVTFTVSATIAAEARGTISNYAQIVAPAGVADPAGSNNFSVYPITQNDVPVDLAVVVTVTPEQYNEGTESNVTYTVTVQNLSGPGVEGATLSDAPASGLALNDWHCTASGGAVCPPDGNGPLSGMTVDLPAGSALIFTVQAAIVDSASGDIDYSAAIGAPNGYSDTDPANDQATATVQALLAVTSPDFVLSKTAGASRMAVNETLRYTISVENSGNAATTAVTVIADDIDGAFRIDALGVGCALVPANSRHVECTIPAGMAAGATETFTIDVTLIDGSLPEGTLITNTAEVSGGGGSACQLSAACTSGANVRVRVAGLPPETTPIPALDQRVLILLILLLGGVAVMARYRR